MVDPFLTLLMVPFPIKKRGKKRFPLSGLHVVNIQSPLLMVSIPFWTLPAPFLGKTHTQFRPLPSAPATTSSPVSSLLGAVVDIMVCFQVKELYRSPAM